MKQAYEGAPTGIGAIYTWTGNKEVGEGRMTIIESRPSDLIRIKLEFLSPSEPPTPRSSPSSLRAIKRRSRGA
jgi:hypothetical protein